MSLSRAFTTRKGRSGSELGQPQKVLQRSNTLTKAPSAPVRPKISGPIQLVHTTNMLSYNAPNLPRLRNHSSFSSSPNSSTHTRSDDDSASQTTVDSTTPPTSPEVTADEGGPSPGAHQLSDPFMMTPRKYAAIPVPETIEEHGDPSAPVIPRRSPSHTKKNSYEAIITRQQSTRLSRGSGHTSSASKESNTFSRASSTSSAATSVAPISEHYTIKHVSPAPTYPIRESATVLSGPEWAPRKEMHPFDQELGQLNELAEEFSANSERQATSEDDQYLQSNNLCKWSASEYLGDISSLYTNFFPETLKSASVPLWI